MIRGLCTRRFIGFVLALCASVSCPEIAPYIAGMYGALVGAAITDALKGK